MFISSRHYCVISLIVVYSNNVIGHYVHKQDIRSGEKSRRFLSLIFPGTKWCGPGNVAKGFHDLGPERETDKCCRDHDNCDDIMSALSYSFKYNLFNYAFHTRLHCSCDDKFHWCLRKVSTPASFIIGNIYFNVLNTKCYKRDYPLVCSSYRYVSLFHSECSRYEYDMSQEKIYQWFDVKSFPY